ncbi:MAG TPA: S-layer homology domain-containing protein, partial [Anaerolineae bacterium]|nr:S-layer homology domain-containing protein [Anaerolineae bacterium]
MTNLGLQKRRVRVALLLVVLIAVLLSGLVFIPGVSTLSNSLKVLPAEAADASIKTGSVINAGAIGESTGTISNPNTPTPTYTDIFPDDWFYEKVIALASKGIVNGYADGSFRPMRSTTRAEMASLLMRAKGLVATGGEPFDDVHGTDWFYGAVVAVYSTGLMNGTNQSHFSPMLPLTREQASAIMVRAAGLESVADIQEQELWLQGFKDRRIISSWARPYVAAAVKYGLMSGYPSQEFKPAAAVNRAETCVLIWNLLYGEIKPLSSYPV